MDFPGKSTGVGCHCLLRVLLRNNLKPWPLEAPFPGTSVFCSAHSLWGLTGRRRMSRGQPGPMCSREPQLFTPSTHLPPHTCSAPLIPEVKQMWENGDQTWTQAQQGGPTRPLDQCPRSPASWGARQPDSRPAPCPTPTLLSLPPPPPGPTLSEAGFLWAIFGADVAGLRSHSRGQGWTSPVRLPRLLGFWTLG